MTEREIQKLIADHTALRNDYTELSAKYATLKEEFALMQQQMDWLRKQLFGRKPGRPPKNCVQSYLLGQQ